RTEGTQLRPAAAFVVPLGRSPLRESLWVPRAIQGRVSPGLPAGLRAGVPERRLQLVAVTEGAGIASSAPGRSRGRRSVRPPAPPISPGRAPRAGSPPPAPPVPARADSRSRGV